MNYLRIDTTIDVDMVGNANQWNRYDFDNVEFSLYYSYEEADSDTIDVGFGNDYVIAQSGGYFELIKVVDEQGNEVELELEKWYIDDLIETQCEDAVKCHLPSDERLDNSTYSHVQDIATFKGVDSEPKANIPFPTINDDLEAVLEAA